MFSREDAYFAQVEELNGLTKPAVSADMTNDELIALIRANAQRIQELRRSNDRFLDELVFDCDVQDMDRAQVEALLGFADRLFRAPNNADHFLAHAIHRKLLKWAELHDDTDMRVRELYCLGTTMVYMNVKSLTLGTNLFCRRIYKYFCEGAAYISQYESIASGQTRAYILRCYGNRKYGTFQYDKFWPEMRREPLVESFHEYMRLFDETMAVLRSPHYREMNPEIPWDAYEYNIHYDRTNFFTELHELGDQEVPEIAQAVLESARFIQAHSRNTEMMHNQAYSMRTEYICAMARYHAGEITLEELLDRLCELFESRNPDDYSTNSQYANMQIPMAAGEYARSLPPERREAYDGRIRPALLAAEGYLHRMTPNEYSGYFSRKVSQLMYLSMVDERLFKRNEVLKLLLACHRPTYVHSRMVAWISLCLCRQLVRVDPGALAGTFDMPDPCASEETRKLLYDTLYSCGMYHDIGKTIVIGQVALYGRRLTEEEFECLQLHPTLGSRLLQKIPASYKLSYAADAALHHHRWADGTTGYPVDCAPPSPATMRICGIISVADSLDAGTDNVGRSYAQAKTFDALVEEIRQGSGTRYDARVAALFDDAGFCAQMRGQLPRERERVYCETYMHMNDSTDMDGKLP